MKKLKLSIEGMHCASCASNVERSLKKVTGVKEASVSLMLKKGTYKLMLFTPGSQEFDSLWDHSITKIIFK